MTRACWVLCISGLICAHLWLGVINSILRKKTKPGEFGTLAYGVTAQEPGL